MSVRRIREATATNKNLAVSGKLTEEWIRNPSWLTLPELTNANSEVVALHTIYLEGNFVALSANNNYTVDWGDGFVEDFSAGNIAYHEFDYNNANVANTNAPITFQGSANTITRNNHGYTDGQTVSFFNIVGTTGVDEAVSYFVINSTSNTFQISTLTNGTPIDLVGDGSATLLPYKQAIVSITPQSANTLTNVDFSIVHNQSDLGTPSTGWLDICVAGKDFDSTGFILTKNNGFSPILDVYHSQLQQFICRSLGGQTSMFYFFAGCANIKNVELYDTNSVTNMSNIFSDCASLISIVLFDTSNVTDMSYMFQVCGSLTSVPLFDTSNVTNMLSCFNSCHSLLSVPLFNTSNVTNMSYMFQNCGSLTSVPLFDTSNVTDMSYMFEECKSLTSVPLFDTSNVTNMERTFSNCYSLTSVPLFDTSNVLQMSSMFVGCPSLVSVPLFDTSNVTYMRGMFGSCFSLVSVPPFNTSNVTDMAYMVTSCVRLSSIPLFDTSNVTDMTGIFYDNRSLHSVPNLDMASVTNFGGFFNTPFYNCVNLSRMKANNISISFNIPGCKLSANALNEIYTNLATVVSKTINVSNNYGVGSDDPTIATSKGWTVTG